MLYQCIPEFTSIRIYEPKWIVFSAIKYIPVSFKVFTKRMSSHCIHIFLGTILAIYILLSCAVNSIYIYLKSSYLWLEQHPKLPTSEHKSYRSSDKIIVLKNLAFCELFASVLDSFHIWFAISVSTDYFCFLFHCFLSFVSFIKFEW